MRHMIIKLILLTIAAVYAFPHNSFAYYDNSWYQHVALNDNPVSKNYTIDPDTDNYLIVTTRWQWSGAYNQFQANESHLVQTPVGYIECIDPGNEEFGQTWIDCGSIEGYLPTDSTEFEIILSFLGDDSSSGSHIAHIIVETQFVPLPTPSPTTIPTPTDKPTPEPTITST